MYYIMNVTKKEVCISDLRLVLPPKRSIDIDKVCDRLDSERSKSLKTAIKKGFIRVMKKDTWWGEAKNPDKPLGPDGRGITEKNLDDFGKRLEDKLASHMNNMISGMSQGDGGSDPDGKVDIIISQLTTLLTNLQNAPPSSPVQEVHNHYGAQNIGDPQYDEIVDMDPETLLRMHEQTVKRMAKNSESKVRTEDKKIKSNVNRNIGELEDLL
tara:strand:- start:734 stop:1369 length:636 start_codon:yes stop_codon:yes gene_type:complete